jgi:hypothetical protein
MLAALLVGVGVLATNPTEADKTADLQAYEAVREKVGRDPKAHVQLALWCEARGLSAERLKHLALAVLLDSKDARARGLLGLVAYGGAWRTPEDVGVRVRANEDLARRLAEYNDRRARTPEKADAQWELALWCERNALGAEAMAHFTAVTRLDSAREAAWKRLGCKKVGGRWVTEAQIAAEKAEAEAQKVADRHWKPLLTKWRDGLGDKSRREAAEKGLAGLTDPRAVAAVWSVLVVGSPSLHGRAVQVLGQIDAPAASRALAFLAVFDPSAEVRRKATETLKQRDPREFAGLLVGSLRKRIKYEIRPVGGPGSPGALFVNGQKFNVQRLYAPPAMPQIDVAPSDLIVPDADGLSVIERYGLSRGPTSQTVQTRTVMSPEQFAQFNPTDPALARAVADYRANAPQLWAHFFQTHVNNAALLRDEPAIEKRNLGVAISVPTATTTTTEHETVIAVGQIMAEYQKAALVAQQQLAQDAALLDAYNGAVDQFNGRVARVLEAISGQGRRDDPESWKAWWVDVQGYQYTPSPETPRPTVVENVPLAYTPDPSPAVSYSATQRQVTTKEPVVSPYSSMPSCFGAGTLVRTLDGARPIESIRVGDCVLTLDVNSGALGYQPVTVIHHNPPSPTFLVKLGGDTIVSSPFHRFWVAGRGWIMARDLKGGERLRLLGGPARVESVESGAVQPVFNLDVALSHDFFAGTAAALVHDNTLPETRLEPFDSPRDVAGAPGD